jgi:hypothetical protein
MRLQWVRDTILIYEMVSKKNTIHTHLTPIKKKALAQSNKLKKKKLKSK